MRSLSTKRKWCASWRCAADEVAARADCANWGDGRCIACDAGGGGAASTASGVVYRVGDRTALERSAANRRGPQRCATAWRALLQEGAGGPLVPGSGERMEAEVIRTEDATGGYRTTKRVAGRTIWPLRGYAGGAEVGRGGPDGEGAGVCRAGGAAGEDRPVVVHHSGGIEGHARGGTGLRTAECGCGLDVDTHPGATADGGRGPNLGTRGGGRRAVLPDLGGRRVGREAVAGGAGWGRCCGTGAGGGGGGGGRGAGGGARRRVGREAVAGGAVWGRCCGTGTGGRAVGGERVAGRVARGRARRRTN